MPIVTYTLCTLAQHCQIPAHHLEQYVQAGLLSIKDESFVLTDNELSWLQQLYSLEQAGFSLQELAQYTKWAWRDGNKNYHLDNETLSKMRTMFEQKMTVLGEQMEQLYEQREFLFLEWSKWDFVYQQQQDKQLVDECVKVLKIHGKFPK